MGKDICKYPVGGLISILHEEIIKLNMRKTVWLKTGQQTWTDICPKKSDKWPTDACKDAQHCSTSRKYKSKPQRDITSHLLLWLSSKRQEIASIGEDVKKGRPHALCWKCKLVQPLGKQMETPQRVRIQLTHNHIILILGSRNINLKSMCTAKFFATLFRVAWDNLAT